MAKNRSIPIVAFVLLGAATLVAQEPPRRPDPLEPVRGLEGTWEGTGEGFGQTSNVRHEWERVLGGRFVRLETRSVPSGETGRESAHEDVGYVSWSEGERILRFRQFLSEGFVNTFRLDPVESPVPGFDFEPESTEGDETVVVRMTLRFDGPDAYTMVLELGTKGQPLKACQTMRLKRVSRE